MTTTTVEREELHQIIQNMPNEKISEALSLIRDFCDEEHVPNEETIKILKDSLAGRNVAGPFHNMNDFMTSLLSDDNA